MLTLYGTDCKKTKDMERFFKKKGIPFKKISDLEELFNTALLRGIDCIPFLVDVQNKVISYEDFTLLKKDLTRYI